MTHSLTEVTAGLRSAAAVLAAIDFTMLDEAFSGPAIGRPGAVVDQLRATWQQAILARVREARAAADEFDRTAEAVAQAAHRYGEAERNAGRAR